MTAAMGKDVRSGEREGPNIPNQSPKRKQLEKYHRVKKSEIPAPKPSLFQYTRFANTSKTFFTLFLWTIQETMCGSSTSPAVTVTPFPRLFGHQRQLFEHHSAILLCVQEEKHSKCYAT